MQSPRVQTPTIEVLNAAPMPVRRIFCVGQNYADHVREMGGDPARPAPFFFTKPADSVVPSGATLPFPTRTRDLHHEVELVVALGAGGSDIAPDAALALVYGHAVGIDLTRRDLQAEAKKVGRPWDMAKGFDQSAPIGPLVLGPPPAAGRIALEVGGQQRQSGDLAQMIWSVAEIIATLSTYVTLAPGDLIFTGTPAGVGPILPGERVVGTMDGVPAVEVRFEG